MTELRKPALSVSAQVMREANHATKGSYYRQLPGLSRSWELVQPIDGLPLPVGSRLDLEGYRHSSTHDNGGWDWLGLLVRVVDGQHSDEHYLVISSAEWGVGVTRGLAVADLLPPHLAVSDVSDMNDLPPETPIDWDSLQASLATRLSAADAWVRRPADSGYEERMHEWMNEGMSPEEWAARHAQDLASFSGGDYSFADRMLDAWVRRLDKILFMPGAVDICRRHFLTPDELQAVLVREAEPF